MCPSWPLQTGTRQSVMGRASSALASATGAYRLRGSAHTAWRRELGAGVVGPSAASFVIAGSRGVLCLAGRASASLPSSSSSWGAYASSSLSLSSSSLLELTTPRLPRLRCTAASTADCGRSRRRPPLGGDTVGATSDGAARTGSDGRGAPPSSSESRTSRRLSRRAALPSSSSGPAAPLGWGDDAADTGAAAGRRGDRRKLWDGTRTDGGEVPRSGGWQGGRRAGKALVHDAHGNSHRVRPARVRPARTAGGFRQP